MPVHQFSEFPFLEYDSNYDFNPSLDVGNGSWIMITRTIPVVEYARPQTYGIYWALPADDIAKRQKVKIFTPHECCILNHEYSIITPEKLEQYREIGYELHRSGLSAVSIPMNRELMEKGRSLSEEEREIIMALMLDGLSESQACEEYFLTRHTDAENINIFYLPSKELREQIVSLFGER